MKRCLVVTSICLAVSVSLLIFAWVSLDKQSRRFRAEEQRTQKELARLFDLQRTRTLSRNGDGLSALISTDVAEIFDNPFQQEICKKLRHPCDLPSLVSAIKDAKDNGFTLNERGRYGLTLLFWAMAKNSEGFIELLRQGADPDLKLTATVPGTELRAGDSVLFSSIACERVGFCISALPFSSEATSSLNHESVNLLVAYSQRQNCSVRIIEDLVKAGVNVNSSGRPEISPLHAVWENCSCPLCCLPLLIGGADPLIKDGQGIDFMEKIDRRLKADAAAGQQDSQLVVLATWLSANGHSTSGKDKK